MKAEIGKDGWRSPNDLPMTDRTVQLAWDDMSTSEKSRGFCDSIAGGDGTRIWWNLKPMFPLKEGHVGAWRDLKLGE